MSLSDIAWQNLRRRKGRAAIIVASLVLGVATVVALVLTTQAMQLDLGNKLDEYGANLVISPGTRQMALSYGGVTIPGVSVGTPEFPESALDNMKTIKNYENLSVVSPKLVGTADVDGRQLLVVGIRFPSELRMKKWWSLDGQRPSDDDQVILGSEAASRLNKVAGDAVRVNGRELKVAAVIRQTGGSEDTLIYLDLAVTQNLLNRPAKLTFIEASALCNTCPIDDIIAQVQQVLPGAKVTALKQTVKAREEIVTRFQGFAIALAAVVLLASGLSVFATVLSSLNERTREIGILRAIGYRKSHVTSVIMRESLLLSLLGGLAGYAAGRLLAGGIAARMADSVSDLPAIGWLLPAALGLAVCVGVVATAYPCWRTSRIDPSESLRFV
ncbi:MAG: ABC transporter permease [Bacillota bacterium]|nr:ABC transporter permease [Bacillota bacterium]